MFELTNSCVKKDTRDLDALSVTIPIAYIRNSQVEQLINLYPNVATYIYALNRDDNYGFVKDDGTVRHSGQMGEYDPIDATHGMIASYIGTPFEKAHLFNSEQDYDDWRRSTGYRTPHYSDYGRFNPLTFDKQEKENVKRILANRIQERAQLKKEYLDFTKDINEITKRGE